MLSGCSLYDNSDNSTALTVGGSAAITAYSVGVVGNLTGRSNITTTQGIMTGMGAIPDPYATMSFPAFSACTQNNFNANSKDPITIDPGVYCGGMATKRIGLIATASTTYTEAYNLAQIGRAHV